MRRMDGWVWCVDLGGGLVAEDVPAIRRWSEPRWQRRLVAFAQTFVGERGEAEDVAQETLLRAEARYGELRDPDRAEAWLFRICRHAAIDHVRARRVRQRVWGGWPELEESFSARAEGPDPVPGLDPGLRLQELPAHQRLLVQLHYDLGVSQPWLCRWTGLSAAALRVRLFRARGRLRGGGAQGRSNAVP